MILREKDLADEQLLPLARSISSIAAGHGRRLIVNSSLEVAGAVKAWGVQLPFGIFDEARRDGRLEKNNFGVSVHSLEQAVIAEEAGARWVLAGNIFATDCKKGLPGRGPEFLRKLKHRLSIPVWAVGGLSAGNIELAARAGADAVCLMSGLLQAENVESEVERCLESFRRARLP